jgi:hypothetical protein
MRQKYFNHIKLNSNKNIGQWDLDDEIWLVCWSGEYIWRENLLKWIAQRRYGESDLAMLLEMLLAFFDSNLFFFKNKEIIVATGPGSCDIL